MRSRQNIHVNFESFWQGSFQLGYNRQADYGRHRALWDGRFEVDFDLRHLVIDLNILQRDDLELFQG